MSLPYKKLLSFFLATIATYTVAAQTSLIASGASWKYLDNGTNQGTAWIATGFSDAAWASGNAQLGYGDGDEATVVGYGGNTSARYITTYFRKTITIADAAAFSNFALSVKRDDGIVLYVNGVEKYRSNMPTGTVTYTTLASAAASDDGGTWQTATLAAGTFVTGTNVVAVEIHQSGATSSDISFDLQLTGTVVPAQTSLVPAGAAWKYLDNGTNQGTAWIATGFSDAAWASGNAQLGYGDGDEATVVSYGGNTSARYITTYFRKTISIADAASFGSYALSVKRDDGIIMYVNGVEKYRSNMPTGTVTYTSLASTAASDDGGTWQTATLAAGTFITGTNVIAVEIHQSSATSTDISFDLELKANDNTAPAISSLSPADNAVSIAGNAPLVINFTETVQKGTGNISIKEGGVITQTIDIASAAVSVSGATVTIVPPANFGSGAAVNIEMPAGAFKDLATNNFAGITNATTWNFGIQQTVDVTPPVVNTYSPLPAATNVANNASLTMTFNENVQKGTGNILIKEAGVTKQTIDVASSSVTVSNNSVTIAHSVFTYSAAVNIEMPAGAFKDLANNNFAGITNATTWNFGIQQTADVTPPVVNTYSPSPAATNVANNAGLVMTFNENVQKGTGSILIKEGGVTKQTIDVASSSVTVSNNSVTIAHSVFASGAAVNIEMPTGIFKDLANNNFAGITNATTWNFSVAAASTTLTRGPYLQMGTSNSVIIRWRSAAATNTKVSYGLTAASLTSTASNASSVTDHEIQLTGLSPDTKYFYSVGSSSQTLQGDANNYFVTAPVVGTEKKTRVWVNGDCGNNSTNQKNVRDQLINYMGTNYTDVWLLLGDNAYNTGTDAEFQTNFFDIYKDKLLKQTVLWPSPGNHDYADNATRANDHAIPYYSMFTLPTNAQAGGVASNTEAFYSYNYGNIHFVSLDSYGKEGNTYKLYDTLGPQVVWLKQDLAANTQKWTILYWHHAPYTLTSHNSETESELYNIRQNLLKIVERYKVDLILCGHSHGYERSKLMKGHYGNEASFTTALNVSQSSGKYDGSASSCPYVKSNASSYNGTVYVVAGSAGQLSSATQASYPHAAMYYSNVSNGGSMVLEIEANRLDAKWICADGVIRDKFTIEKDVSVKKNISITPGSSTTLTASWIGSYSWTGGATTRSVTFTPAASTTYIVNDGVSCIADTFNVTVAAARPVSKTAEALTDGKQLAVKIYPNPTSGNTVIEYSCPAEGQVSLEIYDMAGKRIKTLVNQQKKTGTYKYLINAKTERFKPGIYSVRLSAAKQKIMQRLIVTQE